MGALTVLALVVLPAMCLAQSPNPFAGLAATQQLAPNAEVVEANGPLSAAFAKIPLLAEVTSNPQLSASSPYVDYVLNDPDVITALQKASSASAPEALATFIAALPPVLAETFLEQGFAPVTGVASTDIANNVKGVMATPGFDAAVQAGYAKGNRKLLAD